MPQGQELLYSLPDDGGFVVARDDDENVVRHNRASGWLG
jgi:hypothetical protein